MAELASGSDVLAVEAPRRAGWAMSRGLQLALLTPLVLVVHGYHPFSDDAGIYVAGVLHLLHPSLYPKNAAFVTAQAHYSAFAYLMAAVARLTHLPLGWILFAAYLLSIVAFLAGCQAVAARLFASEPAQNCAVLLAAACFTLPAAGTALFLMDPYVTARSFSTPMGLFAVAACLDRAWGRMVLLLIGAALLHPLMAGFVAAFVMVEAAVSSGRLRLAAGLCGAGCAAFGVAFAAARLAPVSPAYRQIVSLRPFLFLMRWHGYEQLGLALPLLLFGAAAWRFGTSTRKGSICWSCVLVGMSTVLIALLFVPPQGPYLLARFQLLRSFHLIYLMGVLLLGGWVSRLGARSRPALAAVFVLLFGLMAAVQRLSWPASPALELPGTRVTNPWEQAFVWVRENTPADAVFAFNPHLMFLPAEGSVGFRAVSERDQLAGDKDAGVAVLEPGLAERALREREAEMGIDSMSDAQRLALRRLGANWALLSASAATQLPCPYRNAAVQVCRLK